MTEQDPLNPQIPHSARIWNYWLGGKDNYPADRMAGEAVKELIPDIDVSAQADRAFLARAVRHVLGAGVNQFLDIGTGLPSADNTHEVAQAVDPASRVVYVDNDPLVLTHARALLTGIKGSTAYIDADARDPETILRVAAETLDLGRPVAVMMLGILNHVLDDAEALSIVERTMAGVPSGSFLAISHPTAEVHGDAMHASMAQVMEQGGTPIKARNPAEMTALFAGLDLVEPGVVSCSRWHPEATPWGPPKEVAHFCGLARKP
ncbi:SAM-dependent methyltransferase [Actinomadura craniellae]|uniref:SAM-dependent methyltransferase n=1 Tax=Actinomadura craniellae TaxID=2231787 RepID=A0A365H5B0_9ACTN|nr:SAM-dependent methyltransferase [Actinomadura craniellae]RAY14239.1 SAM-dependent methyltransferase [Actinomadura craniellae]